MIKPSKPENEAARLRALLDLEIMDTGQDTAYDDLVGLAANVCNTPSALISFVGAERQWLKSQRNVSLFSDTRDEAFCGHTILVPNEVMVVSDTTKDPRFRFNQLVTQGGIRFYAGAPLLSVGGVAVGALCVLDRRPRSLEPEQLIALQALSRQVMRLVELRRVSNALARQLREREWYERQLIEYQTGLETANADLLEQVRSDALTGLANGHAFTHALLVNVEAVQRGSGAFSVVMLDIDYFKHINDLIGHEQGDHVLLSLASMLREKAPLQALVARYSSAKFALLLPGADALEAMRQAELLRQEACLLQVGVPLTVSLGVASHCPSEAVDALLKRVDVALRSAKRAGRDCTVLAD